MKKTGEVLSQFEAIGWCWLLGDAGRLDLQNESGTVATGRRGCLAWRAGVDHREHGICSIHTTCYYTPKAFVSGFLKQSDGEGGILREARGGIHAAVSPAGSMELRSGGARDRCGDQTQRRAMRLFGQLRTSTRTFLRERFPQFRDLVASWGSNMSRKPIPVVASGALSMRGNQDRIKREPVAARLYAFGKWVCNRLQGQIDWPAPYSLLEGVGGGAPGLPGVVA